MTLLILVTTAIVTVVLLRLTLAPLKLQYLPVGLEWKAKLLPTLLQVLIQGLLIWLLWKLFSVLQ